MKYDVVIEYSIPGVPVSQVTRTVEADSAEGALQSAKLDLLKVRVISIMPNEDGLLQVGLPIVSI